MFADLSHYRACLTLPTTFADSPDSCSIADLRLPSQPRGLPSTVQMSQYKPALLTPHGLPGARGNIWQLSTLLHASGAHSSFSCPKMSFLMFQNSPMTNHTGKCIRASAVPRQHHAKTGAPHIPTASSFLCLVVALARLILLPLAMRSLLRPSPPAVSAACCGVRWSWSPAAAGGRSWAACTSPQARSACQQSARVQDVACDTCVQVDGLHRSGARPVEHSQECCPQGCSISSHRPEQ